MKVYSSGDLRKGIIRLITAGCQLAIMFYFVENVLTFKFGFSIPSMILLFAFVGWIVWVEESIDRIRYAFVSGIDIVAELRADADDLQAEINAGTEE